MLLLCYPKCSTCQKAIKWLKENHIAFKVRNIKEENPSFEELKGWHEMSGQPPKRFFNTSGLVYRSLELKDKLPHMDAEEQLKLLSGDGMLVKRPLAVLEGKVLIGFREKEWEDQLL